ncbi:uncharacterized protein LOC125036187 [Penaeus chinensis]|uniref:uncharacterized protein LOC125036187 n=1 Tax=Penaeus chinensis TaxID=139456 RepID=UPI001FB7BC55|nr:uncharacterized protein LOC125036187 [Penaeus chinensis]
MISYPPVIERKRHKVFVSGLTMAYAAETGDWDEFYHPALQTEEEVLLVYEEQFPLNDFWKDHFNLAILQQILDTKFNCHPSSEYVAKKEVSQSSRHLLVKCKVCNCDLVRYAVLMSHHDGKKHKKMYQNNLKKLMDPSFERKIELRSLAQPMEGFHPGTLEYLINNDPQPIVGVQFLYSNTMNGTRSYHCKLCTFCSHTQEMMLAHLKSVYHVKSFFITKYKMDIPQSEMNAACRRVVCNEGQINHMIPEFSLSRGVQGQVTKETEMKRKCLEVESNAMLAMAKEVGVQKELDPYLCITLAKRVPMMYRTTEKMDLSKLAFFMSYIYLSIKKLDLYYTVKGDEFNMVKMKKLFYYFSNVCNDMNLVPPRECPDGELSPSKTHLSHK